MDEIVRSTKARLDAPIAKLGQRVADASAALEVWFKTIRPTLGEAKSIELMHGTIGVRKSGRSLGLLAGETWDSVLVTLRKKFRAFVRLKREVDRAEILKRVSAGKVNDAQLKRMGVEILQGDNFYFEVKEA